jgi:hypothetical protein
MTYREGVTFNQEKIVLGAEVGVPMSLNCMGV